MQSETPPERKRPPLSRAATAVADEAARIGIDPENLLHFRAARRRTLEQRLGVFVKVQKPVFHDAGHRVFASTADYRQWCNEHLPRWLGYGTD
ncbi:MAG: hypothetical protein OXG04_19505 [Acidobacteria bacterium]|nr:hypothetical protein [Acidobacteriota bacterium]